MRQIKFRAWDKLNYKWVYFTIGQTWSDITLIVYHRIILEGEKLYQFTGLVDKNGKEIYEGDIYEANGGKYQVFFVSGAFVGGKNIQSTSPIGWDNEEDENEKGSYDLIESDFPNKIEIIGNIYENPELLNK